MAFSQSDDEWKNKRLYTGMWLGYGTGFSMGIQADVQIFKYFSLGIETGLSDNLYPTISLLPKAVFRPWKMEISIFAGPIYGNNLTYGALWSMVYGMDIGYHLGPGMLYATIHNGMGYSFGLGYKMGFFDRKQKNEP